MKNTRKNIISKENLDIVRERERESHTLNQ